MFNDIDNIEDIYVSENDIDLSETEDNTMNMDSFCTQEDYTFIELSNSLYEMDYNSINMAESFLHHHGSSLTVDEVNESIQKASDFFNMESPMIVLNGESLGVDDIDLTMVNDDVFSFNPDNLQSIGITEKEGLDWAITHENTQRILQGLNTGFSEQQEELCCDYMSGVSVGIDSMNTEQMVNLLVKKQEAITHPAEQLHIEAFQEGQEFVKNYFAEHGHEPTFDDCLEHFKSSKSFSSTADPLAIVPNDEISFKGYTQSEIDHHISKAEKDMHEAKSRSDYWGNWIRKHGTDDLESAESKLRDANRDFESAKSEYNKWKHTHPDKK